jgi:hypothetical protein
MAYEEELMHHEDSMKSLVYSYNDERQLKDCFVTFFHFMSLDLG